MAASPATSPRLPSPPPIAEDQIGPTSPLPGGGEIGKTELHEDFNQHAWKRIRPGTKSADIPEGPPLMDFAEIDSPFQLTEHLKALYNAAIHRVDSQSTTPIDRETACRLAQPPDGIDKALWLYELCRFLCQKVNLIINALFSDTPPCSSITCNEMRASEWQYLCAVHDPPKPCCAIDYCCHTLDWAANILTSPKQFPSRLTFSTEDDGTHHQLRQLTNIFRRVYRIFAHAWFQHQEAFWKVEASTGLYMFFKTVCDLYGLIPEDSYTIPASAEGIESAEAAPMPTEEKEQPHVELARHAPLASAIDTGSAAATTQVATGHTTKRHRQMHSTGAASVSTVIEENEEEEKEDQATKEATTEAGKEAEQTHEKAPAESVENTTAPSRDLDSETLTTIEKVPSPVVEAEEALEEEASVAEKTTMSTTEPFPTIADATAQKPSHTDDEPPAPAEVVLTKTQPALGDNKILSATGDPTKQMPLKTTLEHDKSVDLAEAEARDIAQGNSQDVSGERLVSSSREKPLT